MSESKTLFCIPFAGGNAYSYRPLEAHLSPPIKVVPLEPPGRGRRIKESPLSSLPAIALDLIDSMRPSLNQPFALFGHSMGALAAYEVTLRLREEHLPTPVHLFLSGIGPPHCLDRESRWHELPPEEFIKKLTELGGSPAAVLAHQELMEFFVPIIRDDFRMVADYRPDPGFPLQVPITVMIGSAEQTTRDKALEWSGLTTSECRFKHYEGGHFFLFDHLPDICSQIYSTLMES